MKTIKELELEYVKNHNLTTRQAKRHIELCKPLKIKIHNKLSNKYIIYNIENKQLVNRR